MRLNVVPCTSLIRQLRLVWALLFIIYQDCFVLFISAFLIGFDMFIGKDCLNAFTLLLLEVPAHFGCDVLPPFQNIRCFRFVKQMYLGNFSVYIQVNLWIKRCLNTFASQTYNILYFKTEGVLG
jgi:hypothetical protein